MNAPTPPPAPNLPPALEARLTELNGHHAAVMLQLTEERHNALTRAVELLRDTIRDIETASLQNLDQQRDAWLQACDEAYADYPAYQIEWRKYVQQAFPETAEDGATVMPADPELPREPAPLAESGLRS